MIMLHTLRENCQHYSTLIWKWIIPRRYQDAYSVCKPTKESTRSREWTKSRASGAKPPGPMTVVYRRREGTEAETTTTKEQYPERYFRRCKIQIKGPKWTLCVSNPEDMEFVSACESFLDLEAF